MSSTGRFLTALRRVVGVFRPGRSACRVSSGSGRSTTLRHPPAVPGEAMPGRFGPDATIPIDPSRVRGAVFAYRPERDADPDPGEVVWTWVPYREADGRGKDRPVAILAADGKGSFLAVELTSKAHDGDDRFLALGAGAWDARGRPSWAKLDRVLRVRTGGMRREAAALDAERYALLTATLRRRYRWD